MNHGIENYDLRQLSGCSERFSVFDIDFSNSFLSFLLFRSSSWKWPTFWFSSAASPLFSVSYPFLIWFYEINAFPALAVHSIDCQIMSPEMNLTWTWHLNFPPYCILKKKNTHRWCALRNNNCITTMSCIEYFNLCLVVGWECCWMRMSFHFNWIRFWQMKGCRVCRTAFSSRWS